MRKLRQIKTWVSDFTCTKCGTTDVMYHHGFSSKKEAIKDIPTYTREIPFSGTWNGWFVGKKGEELCPLCFGFDVKSLDKH